MENVIEWDKTYIVGTTTELACFDDMPVFKDSIKS